MKAVVLSAGQIADYGRVRACVGTPDLVICADGGVSHAQALGLTPTLILGDFDSAGAELIEAEAARGVPVERVPVEKDETDTHLAVAAALERGARELMLVGATGDRLDHTFANLLLLPGIPANVDVSIVDTKNIIRLLRPGGRITVPAATGSYLSLLPLSPEAKGVVAEGVKWPLDGATLRWGASLGVSNQVVEEEAFIAVREGYLVVIQAWD
ncbi:MAG TPA: thiamine diphosphokinase [Symbiobacteriaceae bacterium]|nr:thiamine diphosphokinase [Symbiobacteriaceae bacterium]